MLPDAVRLPTTTGDDDKLARPRHFRTVDWTRKGAACTGEMLFAGAGTTAPPICAFRWVGAPLGPNASVDRSGPRRTMGA